MNRFSKNAELEALLFIAGEEGLSTKELLVALKVEKEQLEQLLSELRIKYRQSTSGIDLLYTRKSYKLATKALYEETVQRYAQSSDAQQLSNQALEVLAIIAYRQPVTRLAIEEIRGVQSSGLIQKLQLYNLIKEDGRLDVPGRPFIYSTTSYFLDYFSLNSLKDLPVVEEKKSEDRNLFFDSI